MSANDFQFIYPLLVAAFLTAFGWLLRNAWDDIKEKIDDLDAAFTRVTSEIVAKHAALEQRIEGIDRRLVRVESWKELFTLPDMQGRSRRVTDRLAERHMDEDLLTRHYREDGQDG